MIILIAQVARPSRALLACLTMAHVAVVVASDGLVDPTQPYRAGAVVHAHGDVLPSLQLQAILHSKARCLAIINGQLVHTGDQVSGAAITSIDANTVHYTHRGRAYRLQLASNSLPESQLRMTRAPAQDVSP